MFIFEVSICTIFEYSCVSYALLKKLFLALILDVIFLLQTSTNAQMILIPANMGVQI